jgi:predicted  nucleic acid-binding Zn-ribbon protein
MKGTRVREQLRALVKLAEIDAKARGIDDRLRGLPIELEERRLGVKRLEDLVARQRNALTDAERLLGTQELDVASRNEALSKAKSKGAKAKNGREAEAAERELEGVRRSIKDGETHRDALKERIEKMRGSLGEPEKALEEAKGELATAESELEGKLATLREERAGIVAGREVYAKQIHKDHTRIYDRIVKGKPPAVCEVNANGTCSACRMAVAPQRFIEIQRGEILNCQSCQRFLYVKASLDE